MVNYVISLKDSEKRRQHIISEFKIHNIDFVFFDALYPSEILNEHINNYLPNLKESSLTEVEKACFMSHYMLLLKGINENYDYFTIFEDDIILGENSNKYLNNYDWFEHLDVRKEFIIKLESFPKKVIKGTPRYSVLDREIFKLNRSYVGAAGYIISKRAAIKAVKLIKQLPPHSLDAIDELLFNHFILNKELTVFQLNPALCIQERFYNNEHSALPSYLETDRAIRLKKIGEYRKKKNILNSIAKEFRRFVEKIRRRTVEFK
ncbi:glycosyltransferase family 25 protein [Glaesserella parasuis]|nr:glycosyltransferase family 25 protein [Glaesserella parasuis]MDP0059560.1 glycosyltransferase family 25 protein [Glaesserella parasuis]MDP0061980.1 glycosyltransferase family 25 protein [Glaesserella parasuis]MDP0140846.1 glycosyltransferase family 25 protein [Glaesserella parasuis]